jgi:polyisoprenoid-binding protein YceI
MRIVKRLVLMVVAVAVLVSAGTFVYINFVRDDAPDRFAIEADESGGAPAEDTGDISGTWKASSGSKAGYRVNEVLFGQRSTAVGRTTDVSGTLRLTGTTVDAATVEVDLTTVTSDEERRDNQFKGRIMDVARFPTATFELAEPIALDELPPLGTLITEQAVGDLTLHGTTKRVTFELTAKRTPSTIVVKGSIPITFADYGIPNPSFGGVVTTEDHGELEFLVTYKQS